MEPRGLQIEFCFHIVYLLYNPKYFIFHIKNMIRRSPQAFPDYQRGVRHKEVQGSYEPGQPSELPGVWQRRGLLWLSTLARVLVTRALPLEGQRTILTLVWMQRAQRIELGQKLVRNLQKKSLVRQNEAIFLAEQPQLHPFLSCCWQRLSPWLHSLISSCSTGSTFGPVLGLFILALIFGSYTALRQPIWSDIALSLGVTLHDADWWPQDFGPLSWHV